MEGSVFRAGMPLPETYQPAPGLEGVYYLQAVHGRGWIASSFFVPRAAGNILVSPLVYSDALGDFFEAHGGIDLIFVTHRDEISAVVLSEVGRDGPGDLPAQIPACEYKARFRCQIAVHAADAGILDECSIDLLWRTDHSPAPGLEFVHTPWHTPGSASLLLDGPAGRLLFCGDCAALDETGQVSTDFEEEFVDPSLPQILKNWAKICEYDFDALIPLHRLTGSPLPYIVPGGRAALKAAHDEVTEWLGWQGPPH